MPSITRDGVRISYQDAGQGLPILLLHGFPLSGESFRPQLDSLSKKYRVIVPDHRGFGQSSLGSGPSEMSHFAADALAVLDALKIQQAVVGGVSMGGYVALALLRAAPQRVKALLLLDTQCGADDEAGKQKREDTARAVTERGMRVLLDAMGPKLIAPASQAALKPALEAMILANPPAGSAAALRGMALRPDCSDLLAKHQGPTLVVVGEKDEILPLPKSEQMAKLVSGSKLAVIPGAGHLANWEAPDAFHKALDEFLAGVK